MSFRNRYLLEKWPTAAAMGGAVLRGGLARRVLSKHEAKLRELSVERPPLPRSLVLDYIRHVGGDPAAWAGDLPTHLFPQWVFPLQLRLLGALGVPLARALNAGAKLESARPLPMGESLIVRAWLESVDDGDGRVILTVASSTGTASAPNALRAEMTLVLRRSGKQTRGKREKPKVPEDAVELGRFHVPDGAGKDFARLTGDINPVHWLPPYARALGFSHVINHGFSSMARSIEVLIRERYESKPRELTHFECRFTRPLLLPADAIVFSRDSEIFLGDAPGEHAGPGDETAAENHQHGEDARKDENIENQNTEIVVPARRAMSDRHLGHVLNA